MPDARWSRIRTVAGRAIDAVGGGGAGVGAGGMREQQLVVQQLEQLDSSTSAASSGPGAGKPAVTIGDKNFAEENILGAALRAGAESEGLQRSPESQHRLLGDHLQGADVRADRHVPGVHRHAAVGDRRTDEAADERRGRVQAGEGVRRRARASRCSTTRRSTTPTRWRRCRATPAKNNLTSVADLKPLGKKVTLGAAPEFATRFEGLLGLKKEYGVKPTFKPIAIELSYKALESGQVDVQDVFTTDGQLLGGKFKVLADPKHVFGFQNVAPVVKQSVLSAEGPAFAETLNKVSALLTIPAIQQMNKAVSIDKQSAATVAEQFLKANSLI